MVNPANIIVLSMTTRPVFALVLTLHIAAASLAAQDSVLAPPENVVVDGIPALPRTLQSQIAPYTRARAAELLSWHPQRREMLIATFFGNVAQVHLVKMPRGARTQLTFFDDRPTRGVSYQPTNGSYFILLKDSAGNQNAQIYRYDFTDAKITLLTDGRSLNSAGVWAHRGDRIAYTSTRRTGRDADLYVVKPLEPQSTRMVVALEGGDWNALDWAPDDRSILMQQRRSINESRLWRIDVQTAVRTLLTPDSSPTAYEAPKFTADGSGLYVLTDQGEEFQRLAVLDLQTHRLRFLTAAIPWDVYQYEVSPDGATIAVVTNEDGLLVLRLLDARTGRERKLPGRKERITGVFGMSWHPSGRWLGVTRDSGRETADAYALDVTTGVLERWTFSETGIDTRRFVEPELIRWKSEDGRMISGFLYRPPARFTGKRPVVVDIHGGPEGQFQPYFLGRYNYIMNELGIAMLFPNIRGSSGYGKTFVKLDDGVLRENAYRDMGALLDWIAAEPSLDASRVMVTGASYGGHMALVVAARYPERIRCAVDIYGPSNLVTFLEHTADYRRDQRRAEYGDERDSTARAFMERTAPLTNAAKITKPLLVVQGANDPFVPPSESEQMIRAVRANGVPVWYLLAKDEGHGFVKKATGDYQLYATVMFIKTYLLN
jgi:dipeptidyl aminopeptidase/acylaminoacyl peptidase